MKIVKFLNRNPLCYQSGLRYTNGTGVLAALGIGSTLLGTGASIASQVRSNSYQAHLASEMQSEAMAFNREEAEKQRDWQHRESEIARGWQSDEWTRQFGLQNSEWFNRFQSQNKEWYNQQRYANNLALQQWYKQQEYNSPAATIQRGMEAGVNPAASLGFNYGSTGLSAAPTGVGSPSVSSPSPMPSDIGAGSQGSVGTGSLANIKNPADAISSMIGSIGTFVKDLSSAGLNKSQSNEISTLLAQKLRGLYLDNENKEFNNKILEVDAFIKENIKDAEVGKAWDEWVKLGADIMYTNQLTDTAKQQEFFYKYESLLSKAKEKLTSQQYLQLCATFDSVIELYHQQINSEKAKQSEMYAQSFKLRAEGTTENELRPLREKLLELNQELVRAQGHGARLDNLVKDATWKAKAETIIEQATQMNLITAQEKEKLRKAFNENHVFYIDRFFNWLGQGAGAFRDFGIGSSMMNGNLPKSTPVDSPWTIYGGSEGTSTM